MQLYLNLASPFQFKDTKKHSISVTGADDDGCNWLANYGILLVIQSTVTLGLTGATRENASKANRIVCNKKRNVAEVVE